MRAGRGSDGRLGWGGLRLAAELGLAAGVVSAVALAVTGPASRLATWPSGGQGLQLAGASTSEGAASLQLAAGFVLGQLPPPLDQPAPAAYEVPVASPPPALSLPSLPAIPTLPAPPAPAPAHTPAPTAPPTAPPQAPRRQPAAIGPGSATRAPRPVPVRTPSSMPSPPPPPERTAELTGPAAETLSELNQARAMNGLSQLRADAALTAAAVEHAAQIAAMGQMSHAGYVDDVNSQGVSWRGLGEVLGANDTSPDASTIDQLWMQSPEHRPIILDPQYASVGIGWARSDSGWWYVAAILEY